MVTQWQPVKMNHTVILRICGGSRHVLSDSRSLPARVSVFPPTDCADMWWWLVGIAVALYLIHRFSPLIYDVIIVNMTARWYAAVLAQLGAHLPAGARVLDVGIGTGSALAANAQTGAAQIWPMSCKH